MQRPARPRKNAAIPSPAGSNSLWLRVGILIDGTGRTPLADSHVVYDKSSILFVGSGRDTPPPHVLNPGQTQPDFDLPNYTLLPGLIEAHTHLFLEGGELNAAKRSARLTRSREELLNAAILRIEKLLLLGIIGVRDAGDKIGIGLSLSSLCTSGKSPLMPFVDSPGAAIYHRGHYGSFMGDPLEEYISPRKCVLSRIGDGAERIKLIASDIIDFKAGGVTKDPQMSADEIAAFVAAAAEFGKQTFAHASGEKGIENVVEGRIGSVEHGYFIRDDQLARMRDRQIAWVPTFSPLEQQIKHSEKIGWDDRTTSTMRRILDEHAASLLTAHALGVPIAAGSDSGAIGVRHGLGLLEEMELMEGAGLSSIDVINTATGISSDRLSFKEKFGKIAPGYRSRFILTEHSPLDGVSHLRREKFLVYDSVVIKCGEEPDTAGL